MLDNLLKTFGTLDEGTQESFKWAATMAIRSLHPVLHYGVDLPQLEADNLPIPLAYPSHFVLFDPRYKLPIYTRQRLLPHQAVSHVPRDDDFYPEHTLPGDLQVTAASYAAWNKANPDNPMDLGHLTASRHRRANAYEQHHVDCLSGICPQTPGTNRQVWKDLEAQVYQRGQEEIAIHVQQGCVVTAEEPDWMPDGGPAIPGILWKSIIIERPTSIAMHAWYVYQDRVKGNEKPELVRCTVDELSGLLGWQVWRGIRGAQYRNRNNKDWW